jgi:heterodisulfide reductase subunit A-like polyferredoxin
LNIELVTNAEVLDVTGEEGNFQAKILEKPRYIDLKKCTSCGECAKVCPIEVSNEYNEGLDNRKAAFKRYPQAIPGAYGISKRGTAPCKAACPAHVSIQGYIALTNQGKYAEALALFKEEHPFPAVCGRVCHHPCEKECTRGGVDEPLAIRTLHRFLSDTDFAQDAPYIAPVGEKQDGQVAVIGAGPAGLACAYFLARRGYSVTVYEKLPEPGGMMRVGIPEYRLPRDILAKEIGLIEKMGVTIKCGMEFGKDVTLEGLKKEGVKAVFVATGLHGSRGLGVPGENLEGVLPGTGFLRDTALGNPPKIGDRVVVIGGGNVAMDVALTARRLGAKDVRSVCLESRDEMPAWKYEIEEALDQNVDIVNCWGPKEFVGKDGKVTGVTFKRCTCVFDDQCRFNPQYDENEVDTLEADTVIISIGQSAVPDFAKKEGVSITRRGGLAADPVTLQTPIDWIFAGGDGFYGPKSVVDAVASGKEAAESIHRFIVGMDLSEGRAKNWDYVKPDTTDEPKKARVHEGCLSVDERECGFGEVHFGYTEEQARKEAERCLKCGICSECYQCVAACLAGAVDHSMTAKERTLDVGAVVLCTGSRPYDPAPLEQFYHYGKTPNVLTSLEFERILSASGPTMGHLARPSDHKEPKKIAWLQCVGSRDTNKCGNGYCSAVCCMYAIKDAMIAKEHSHEELDCAIFYMDLRTYGKDYEKYLIRARDKEGVRFVKSRIHTVDIDKATDDVLVRYVNEAGEIEHETFDMLVLSVGLQVTTETRELCERLGVNLDGYGFVENEAFAPVTTSRPGIYACGVTEGPKDIPSSVAQASAAAGAAGVTLAPARNTRTVTVETVEERDLTGEPPRVGVFVCQCGINIAGVVDVPAVQEYARSLPFVVYSGNNLFTCSQDAQDNMKELIKEHGINRVVVASCTPKTHEAIFMDTLEKAGLNKYLFEMANIRNQNSWVHSKEPALATEKAKELVRMAVARAATLAPLSEKQIPVNRRALVVGGGVAGMTAALNLADQDYEVVLVEKEDTLGGMSNRLVKTIEGGDVKALVEALSERVRAHGKIELLLNTLITGFGGFKGNFVTDTLTAPSMAARKIEHGAIILATGANEYQPREFLYGEDSRVQTQVELSKRLEDDPAFAKGVSQMVMIQCVGSRNAENPNCSRICCQSAVKNAIHVKEMNPEADVFILYRDIRTYGTMENYYTKARELGVRFFRFEPEEAPVVEKAGDELLVTFKDHVLGKKLQVAADSLVLSAGLRASDTTDLSSVLKLQRTAEGHFMEAHVKLRPVDMATEGIFLCGTAHSPQLIREAIAQAQGAASRAVTFLSQPFLKLSAVTATVIPEKCASCLICVRSCYYNVPRINEDGVSYIDPALCHGCGLCAAECPAKAIYLNWYEDNQILSKVEALLEGAL